ncbi:hypothetical protein [Pseudomonas citronellolis]|uniref:hypothetical protein n=1 Tax=Pseudomonas citronellolis TaxID=53408 RepID=UPI002D77C21A|nr:hypothetical protein [Pseudomonas citronellolis]WRT83519.1 hypothetical protein VK748_03575 [Pseudomonas citronellolis]
MTDLTKLKELAEKLAPAYRDPWESHRHSASAVTVGAVNESGEYNDFLDVRISDYSDFDEHDDELAEWIAAANPQAILELIERLERAEADAARYRWLREQPNDCSAPRIDVVRWEPMDESANEGEGLRLEALDAAIDAAMGGGGK